MPAIEVLNRFLQETQEQQPAHPDDTSGAEVQRRVAELEARLVGAHTPADARSVCVSTAPALRQLWLRALDSLAGSSSSEGERSTSWRKVQAVWEVFLNKAAGVVQGAPHSPTVAELVGLACWVVVSVASSGVAPHLAAATLRASSHFVIRAVTLVQQNVAGVVSTLSTTVAPLRLLSLTSSLCSAVSAPASLTSVPPEVRGELRAARQAASSASAELLGHHLAIVMNEVVFPEYWALDWSSGRSPALLPKGIHPSLAAVFQYLRRTAYRVRQLSRDDELTQDAEPPMLTSLVAGAALSHATMALLLVARQTSPLHVNRLAQLERDALLLTLIARLVRRCLADCSAANTNTSVSNEALVELLTAVLRRAEVMRAPQQGTAVASPDDIQVSPHTAQLPVSSSSTAPYNAAEEAKSWWSFRRQIWDVQPVESWAELVEPRWDTLWSPSLPCSASIDYVASYSGGLRSSHLPSLMDDN